MFVYSKSKFKVTPLTLCVNKSSIEQASFEIQFRYQLWPLDKKLRVIEQAKMYQKRHESEMEERLAQSKTFASRLQQAQLWLIKFALVKIGD